MNFDHEQFMRRCLELGTVARVQGNTPVGSIVVLDGVIIGEGIETLPVGSSITGHAETLACQAALDAIGRKYLAGAILYTTAEPCFMCAYAIRQLRIGFVVYGIDTPIIGAVTSTHPILTDPALDSWRPAPTVIGGVLREECERLRFEPIIEPEEDVTSFPHGVETPLMLVDILGITDDAKRYEMIRQLCWPDGTRCPRADDDPAAGRDRSAQARGETRG
jgi:tRNA(adenine34) deaminase